MLPDPIYYVNNKGEYVYLIYEEKDENGHGHDLHKASSSTIIKYCELYMIFKYIAEYKVTLTDDEKEQLNNKIIDECNRIDIYNIHKCLEYLNLKDGSHRLCDAIEDDSCELILNNFYNNNCVISYKALKTLVENYGAQHNWYKYDSKENDIYILSDYTLKLGYMNVLTRKNRGYDIDTLIKELTEHFDISVTKEKFIQYYNIEFNSSIDEIDIDDIVYIITKYDLDPNLKRL